MRKQITAANIRAQYARNLQTWLTMLAKAEASPRQSFNGYNVEILRQNAATYERLSLASDAELHAHFAKARISCALRLADLRKAAR